MGPFPRATICRTVFHPEAFRRLLSFIAVHAVLFTVGTVLHAQQGITYSVGLPGISIPMTSQGLPDQINVDSTGLLAENIHFHFTRRSDGKDIRLTSRDSGLAGMPRYYRQVQEWNGKQVSPELQVVVTGRVHPDSIFFLITITVLEDIELKDLTFHIPMEKRIAKYMSGLGVPGYLRPDTVSWHWNDAPDHRATAWIGDTHAGLWFSLTSSLSGDPGGLLVAVKGRSMLVNAYTGPLSLKKGAVITYLFTLLPTRKPPKGVHLSE